jgi:CheY-like chemotaxis protein
LPQGSLNSCLRLVATVFQELSSFIISHLHYQNALPLLISRRSPTIQAIKFTRTESRRCITIRFGASSYTPSHPPKALGSPIRWFATNKTRPDLTTHPDWGTGEPLYVYFSVSDTGRGLEPDEMTRLFHRFAQASPRTHVQYGGSGLGLFISRELSEMQGGEIGVDSTVGQGSTFAYYIKARRAPTPPKKNVPGASAVRKATAQDLMAFCVHRRSSSIGRTAEEEAKAELDKRQKEEFAVKFHVLLVEDNLVNQRVLSKQLTKAGCAVTVANHGLEALDCLKRTTAWNDDTRESKGEGVELDVILMDVEMPIMDGLTCTKKIRELEQQGMLGRHLSVIAITANARAEQIAVAREAGVVSALLL